MNNNNQDQNNANCRGQGRNNNNNNRSQRGRQQGRGQQRSSRNNGNCNKKSYAIPDTADKELGDNFFITGPEALQKFERTKIAIINYIQKTFTHSEEIKKALKNEQHFNFDDI